MVQTIDSITYIEYKNVLSKAKRYFDYSEINAIPLEEQDGSVEYHQEARYMLGDIMISLDFPEIAISSYSSIFNLNV